MVELGLIFLFLLKVLFSSIHLTVITGDSIVKIRKLNFVLPFHVSTLTTGTQLVRWERAEHR